MSHIVIIVIFILSYLSFISNIIYLLVSGSPKYFGPLLHFLRSGVLEIPPGVSHTALQREAEFYGLKKIVTYFEEEEKRKNEAAKRSESLKSTSVPN